MSAPISVASTPEAWGALRVVGEGARDYLQGQLSQDLSRGEEETWALLLEPDGRLITTLWVLAGVAGYDLVAPGEVLDEVRARLARFALRSRCGFEVLEAPRTPFATVGERLEAGWPSAREFAAHLPAQSFGTALVERCVSFTKGCYTGQELVARLDARAGNVPWRLVLGEGPDLTSIDALLRSKGPSGPQGVTSAIERAAGVLAMGFAHRSLVGQEGDDGDVRLRVL